MVACATKILAHKSGTHREHPIMARERKMCRWYNETSAVKRAYDAGLIEKKWVEDYCWNGGEGCVRKRRFEEEGYVSPDYVLPDGTECEALRGRSF